MPEDEEERNAFAATHERVEYRDMTAVKKVTFGRRSGIRVFGPKPGP
ncbi:hypothetical protein [Bradyrhizobium sp. URHA0013]|jgi:hypothetical protein|nr:hypothetical protein [Bradyrhizobium sp. URHA0013]